MPRHIRPAGPGAAVFFTVAMADRRSDLPLREAARATRRELPFVIDAGVVLPDPLHAVRTLPDGDADDPRRGKDGKTRFTKAVGVAGRQSARNVAKGEAGPWLRQFREHPIRDAADLEARIRHGRISPVQHRVAARAVGWPRSSICREMRRGLVEPEWPGVAPDGRFDAQGGCRPTGAHGVDKNGGSARAVRLARL